MRTEGDLTATGYNLFLKDHEIKKPGFLKSVLNIISICLYICVGLGMEHSWFVWKTFTRRSLAKI